MKDIEMRNFKIQWCETPRECLMQTKAKLEPLLLSLEPKQKHYNRITRALFIIISILINIPIIALLACIAVSPVISLTDETKPAARLAIFVIACIPLFLCMCIFHFSVWNILVHDALHDKLEKALSRHANTPGYKLAELNTLLWYLYYTILAINTMLKVYEAKDFIENQKANGETVHSLMNLYTWDDWDNMTKPANLGMKFFTSKKRWKEGLRDDFYLLLRRIPCFGKQPFIIIDAENNEVNFHALDIYLKDLLADCSQKINRIQIPVDELINMQGYTEAYYDYKHIEPLAACFLRPAALCKKTHRAYAFAG